MAERYGVPPKRFTKEWWPHYWMYYKWHTIAAAVAGIMIITTAVQCATRERYDMTITYTGSFYFAEEQLNALEAEIEKIIDDADGNGEKNVFLQPLVISNMQETAEMDYAMMTKHDLELASGETYIYIYDQSKAEMMLSRDDSSDIYMPVKEWYNGDVQAEECVTNAGGTEGAISLENSSIMKSAGIEPKGLYIAVKADYKGDESTSLMQERAIKLANELLK